MIIININHTVIYYNRKTNGSKFSKSNVNAVESTQVHWKCRLVVIPKQTDTLEILTLPLVLRTRGMAVTLFPPADLPPRFFLAPNKKPTHLF